MTLEAGIRGDQRKCGQAFSSVALVELVHGCELSEDGHELNHSVPGPKCHPLTVLQRLATPKIRDRCEKEPNCR